MSAEQLFKFSIRKNDQVQVIAGREKGKIGKVLKVDSKTGRITVEKVNMVKRHVKPSQQNPNGGIVEKELPLNYSNVLLVCPKCNRGVRHAKKTVSTSSAKGSKKAGTEKVEKKSRVCKRCETVIDAA
jgi:large subunit ribosomal protein L24